MKIAIALAGIVACVHVANAQQAPATIPVRQLTPAVSTDSGLLRYVGNLRPLADGRVMVNDRLARKLVLLDSTLKKMTILADTAAGAPNAYGAGAQVAAIIPFTGDSTLFVDYSSQAFIVIDGAGKFGRIMSPPKVSDLTYMAGAGAGFDPKGRLIYRGYRRPAPGSPSGRGLDGATLTSGVVRVLPGGPDSAPVLRIDFDTRQVDTIAMFKIPSPKLAVLEIRTATGSSGRSAQIFNPLPQTDEWALMPDGTVAIVRGQDYHVDWVAPDDTKRSSPKLPFAWKRITLEEKQQIVDSIKTARVQAEAKNPPPSLSGPAGIVLPPIPFQIVEAAELPDYYPPVRSGQVKADPDGNLWVLPATGIAGNPSGGLVFDVVNRNGEVFERVQLPAGRNLVGFGKGGVIYMSPSAPQLSPTGPFTTTLERATVIRPAVGTIKP